MKLRSFQMPRNVMKEESTFSERYGKFIVEPLERGFGTTLGNALRRTLLSSIPGAAVTGIKIEGVYHEFSTIPGVAEDVTEIVLNLKELRLKLYTDHRKILYLNSSKKGVVTGADIETDADVEIMNPDLKIATLSEGSNLKIEIYVDSGRGYVPADQLRDPNVPIGLIPMDAVFTPIRKVNFQVENTRVEERTDYDRLILEIWTDGTMKPDDALAIAAKILKDHLTLFIDFEEKPEELKTERIDEEARQMRELLEKSIEELELSVRSSNCLRAANIKTLGELVQKTESEMLKYRNFGRKSLSELIGVLADLGLSFGMKIDQYFPKEKGQAKK